MKDSYKLFFNEFKIKFQDIIEFGMAATIFPNQHEVKTEWENLINSIKQNKEVYIRGYGRESKGTYLYQNLFNILLNNQNIKKDPTNNSKPTQLLQNITKYSKNIKKDNNKKEKIINYQVAHIFGRTKNPFLFTAPWNIVWKPKILDPFTGHESKGEQTEKYKKAFMLKSKDMYACYIREYNNIAEKYFSQKKLNIAFKKIKIKDEKIFNQFKKDAIYELSKIE